MNKLNPFFAQVLVFTLSFYPIFLNAQIFPTNGPNEGVPFTILNVGSSCYVTTSNGLYRTDDQGEHFVRLEPGVKFYQALGLAVDKNEIFLAYSNIIGTKHKLCYSFDNGLTWNDISLNLVDWYPFEITYKNDELLVSANNELLHSFTKGKSWEPIQLPKKHGHLSFVRSNFNYFFVGDGRNLFRRGIRDSVWQQVLSLNDYYSEIHITDSVIIVLPDGSNGLISNTNGSTWDEINIQGTNAHYTIADFSDTMYYSGPNFYCSKDKGNHWNAFKPSDKISAFDPFINIGNTPMVILQYESLYKTNDGFKTIQHTGEGIHAGGIIQLLRSDSLLFAVTNQHIWKYNLNTRFWDPHPIIYNKYLGSLFNIKNRLFIIKKYENGLTEIDQFGNIINKHDNLIIPDGRIESKISSFTYKDKTLVLKNGIEIYTENDGEDWRIGYANSPLLPFDDIHELVTYKNLALIEASKNFSQPSSFYTSADLEHWTEFPIKNKNVIDKYTQRILSDGENLFFYITTYESSYWKYNPLDSTLIKCSGLENANNFNSINTITNLGNGKLYLNTSSGSFISENGGLTWSTYFHELDHNVYNLIIDQIDFEDTIYFGTRYSSVVKTAKTSIAGSKHKLLVYYDNNNNFSFDNGDVGLKGNYLKFQQSNEYIPTNENGESQLYYNLPLYDTIFTQNNFKYGNFTPSKIALDASKSNYSFAFQITPGIHDASVFISPISKARPGFSYGNSIDIINNGSEVWTGEVELIFDPIFVFSKSNIQAKSVIGNRAIWDIKNLKALAHQKIIVEFKLSNTTSIHTKYTNSVNIKNLSSQELDPSDDVSIVNGEVVSSFDPNRIEVDKSEISKKMYKDGEWLEYIVHFQNTGSIPADFVVLAINLNYIDISSIEAISGSHNYTYNIPESENIMKVRFNDIQLPDSLHNEIQSHGYFRFRAKPEQFNYDINEISVWANIYFDYNAGVNTNNCITKITNTVNTIDDNKNISNLEIIPNPNSAEFVLQCINCMLDNSIVIYNPVGQKINFKIIDYDNTHCKIRIDQAVPGMYFLRANNLNLLSTFQIIHH